MIRPSAWSPKTMISILQGTSSSVPKRLTGADSAARQMRRKSRSSSSNSARPCMPTTSNDVARRPLGTPHGRVTMDEALMAALVIRHARAVAAPPGIVNNAIDWASM